MTGNTNHISIITLNVNGLNSLIKRHRLADWIKKRPINMLSSRDSSHRKRHPQTESEKMGKKVPRTWTQLKSGHLHPLIRLSELQV